MRDLYIAFSCASSVLTFQNATPPKATATIGTSQTARKPWNIPTRCGMMPPRGRGNSVDQGADRRQAACGADGHQATGDHEKSDGDASLHQYQRDHPPGGRGAHPEGARAEVPV